MNSLTYLYTWVICALFLCATPVSASNTETYLTNNQPQLVRINFTMPNGYVRHLLLAFTPDNAASDGVDYGYDALNPDNFPDDLNWIINNQRYVIQGVGAFHDSKQYPLGMFLSNTGNIAITLDTLENFDKQINVYLYDAVHNSHTLLNEVDFQDTLPEGTYLDRFFITFTNNANPNDSTEEGNLSIHENQNEATSVSYFRTTQELYCRSNQMISQIEVFNLLGKRIGHFQNINSQEYRAPIPITRERYGIIKIYSEKGSTSKKVLF